MQEKKILPQIATCFATAILTLLLGIIDWVTGYELQFFVFYFIPIAIVGWNCGKTQTYAIALLSTGVWLAADLLSGHPYTHIAYTYWNTAIRSIAFFLFGYTITRIRFLLIQERKISSDLQKMLSEVKTLTGLLPICAGCKKIRTDSGYWQQIEEYISKRSDVQFSHGLCQECANKILKDAGLSPIAREQPVEGDSPVSAGTAVRTSPPRH